jgi:PAS domain S-box-containing protein
MNAECRTDLSLLRSIIDGAPIRIFWKDRESRYLGCNMLFAKDAGLNHPDDIIGKTDFDLVSKAQAESYRADDRQVIETGSPKLGYQELETTAINQATWVRTSKTPLRDAQQNIIGVLGVYEDITDYVATTKELEESNALLLTILEMSPDAILLVDENARIQTWNHRFAEIWNVPDELVKAGHDAPVLQWAVNQTVDPESYQAKVREVYASRTADDHTEAHLKDGRILDIHGTPLYAPKGQYMGRLTHFRDITSLRQQEIRTQKTNSLLQAIRQIDEYLLKAGSDKDLYHFVCNQLKDMESFTAAWIVLKSPNHDLVAAGWSGLDEETLNAYSARWDNSERGRGMLGTAVRENRPYVVNDLAADPRLSPWRALQQKAQARSAATFPLASEDEVIGGLMIYSGEINRFDAETVNLLADVARNIGIVVRSLKLDHKLKATLESLKKTLDGTVEAISGLVEYRDPYTAGHERRVARLAKAIGESMSLPEKKLEGLRVAGYIHDLGKISIPAEILSKPGRLTAVEMQLVQQHAQTGYDILKHLEFPWPIAQTVLQHHERLDGSGYPYHLKGDAIILEARIVAVADVVEAISSHRPYRAALGLDFALSEIRKNRGALYDPQVADTCLSLFQNRAFSFE